MKKDVKPNAESRPSQGLGSEEEVPATVGPPPTSHLRSKSEILKHGKSGLSGEFPLSLHCNPNTFSGPQVLPSPKASNNKGGPLQPLTLLKETVF